MFKSAGKTSDFYTSVILYLVQMACVHVQTLCCQRLTI